MIKTAVVTLGCPKNQVDSEFILGVLDKNRFILVGDTREAEVVIVNTCSFIADAKRESLETIFELTTREPQPYIIVAGCMVQQHGRELWQELPEVAAFISPGAIGRLPVIIERVLKGERLLELSSSTEGEEGLPRLTVEGKPYAYLKIAEGCDNCCAYCTIPAIKGPYRSRPIERLVAEARALAATGIKELILVAQDTTAYGLDCYGEYRLPQLLQALACISEIEWIRLLYAYPTRITPQLVEVMAGEEKVVPYMDLPLQHASEDVLRRMNRPGGLKASLKAIDLLRNAMPDIALRSTFIVGFPGEREEDFYRLLEFLKAVRFDWVGAFKYSPEDGTAAASMPGQVPEDVKEERYRRLMLSQQTITKALNERWVGREIPILVEEPGIGRSFRQAPEIDGLIYLEGSHVPPGTFITARITKIRGPYDLVGQVIT